MIEKIVIDGRAHVVSECEVCGENYTQQERLWRKAKWKNRCKDHRKTIHQCVDCGIEVWRGFERCKPCAAKRRANPKRHCVDCGCEINRKAKDRCLSCHNKNQDKGRSKERTKFNVSAEWAEARRLCFERDDYTCQMCGVRGGDLNAHHIKDWCNHPESRLDLSNLQTLCVSCHRALHTGESRIRKWAA